MTQPDRRFERQERFAPLGAARQARLQESRCLLVGCGAKGGVIAHELTRAGVGTLVIAMFDTERNEMMFTATGSKTLSSDNPSPAEQQKRIDEAVAKILEDFPPGSGD